MLYDHFYHRYIIVYQFVNSKIIDLILLIKIIFCILRCPSSLSANKDIVVFREVCGKSAGILREVCRKTTGVVGLLGYCPNFSILLTIDK